MKKILNLLTGICLVAMLAALSACSKSNEILGSVPVSSRVITVLNVKQICADGEVDLSKPAELRGAFVSMLEFVGYLGHEGVADAEEVAFVESGDGQKYMTFYVEDADKFKELLPKTYTWKGDFASGEEGYGICLKDNQVWMAYRSDVAKVVESVTKSKGAVVTDLRGLAEALRTPALANVAVPATVPGAQAKSDALQSSKWNILHAVTDGAKLNLSWNEIQADGNPVKIKGLQEINPAILGYVPENFNITLAAGLTPEFDWTTITRLISGIDDFQTQATLSMVIPYLQSVDGSVLFAAGPANAQAYSEPEAGNWNFIIMAHLPQAKINELLGMVRGMMFTAGMTPRTDPATGMMVVPQYGANLYIGTIDGYLAVGTVPFSPNNQNELAPTFVNSQVAVSASIPTFQAIDPSMPAFGGNISGAVKGGEGQLSVTLPGSAGTVISNILKNL